MRILVIGDVHFKIKNVKQTELFVAKLFHLLNSIPKVDEIVLLGDLLHDHEKLHISPLNRVTNLIDKLPKPVRILVGNHDMINHMQIMNTNHWMNGLKKWDGVDIIDTVKKIDNRIYMPYVPNGKFVECLDAIESWDACKIVFAHQEFKGCKMGGKVSTSGDVYSGPPVVSGHIHSRQFLLKNEIVNAFGTLTRDSIYYTGSAFQHSFGDRGACFLC